MAIKNSVSNDFFITFVNSINVFDCHLSGVFMWAKNSVVPDQLVSSEALSTLSSYTYESTLSNKPYQRISALFGPQREKLSSWVFQTKKAQTSLHVLHSLISPFIIRLLESIISRLVTTKFQFSS